MQIYHNHAKELTKVTDEDVLEYVQMDCDDFNIKLENGTWIKATMDGRYFDGEDEYAPVLELDKDDPSFDADDITAYEGEETLVGFVKVA